MRLAVRRVRDLEHNAPVRGVGFHHTQLDRVTRTVVLLELLGVFDTGVGHRNEAFDVVPEAYDDALLLNAHDVALEFHPRGESVRDRRPRIIGELLHAQRDALVLRVDVEHQNLDVLSFLDHLRRVLDAPGPTHVGHVDETVDTRLDLHESTERSEVAHRPSELGARRVLHRQRQPRIFFDLLHAQRDLLVVRVDLEHHHFDLLGDGHDLGGVADVTGPGHLRDVYEPFDALLQFDERAVIRDRDDFSTDA